MRVCVCVCVCVCEYLFPFLLLIHKHASMLTPPDPRNLLVNRNRFSLSVLSLLVIFVRPCMMVLV